MYKFPLLFLLSISFQLSYTQTVNDLAVFLGSELNGTARYNAMAGAFGALGGDLSGMAINPAGSSVFLYSEFGTTMTSYVLLPLWCSRYQSILHLDNTWLKNGEVGRHCYVHLLQ